MKESTKAKFDQIAEVLRDKKVVVAFSGGVDSSTLAHIAKQTAREVYLLTIDSETVPDEEKERAKLIAEELGLPLDTIKFKWLAEDILASNPINRCYECKALMAKTWLKYAKEKEVDFVIEGTNASELKGYRPGAKALEECDVISPFKDAGITKTEIREYARHVGLSVADTPSMACMATRFPYETRIDENMLDNIQRIEREVKALLKVDCIRARYHGDVVRIELDPNDIKRVFESDILEELVSIGHDSGFKYVTLDLQGYRTGSMDEGNLIVEE